MASSQVADCEYYHPTPTQADKERVEALLMDRREDGCFLIRDSISSDIKLYALCLYVRKSDRLARYHIKGNKCTGYCFRGKDKEWNTQPVTHPTLNDLIEHRTSLGENDGLLTRLKCGIKREDSVPSDEKYSSNGEPLPDAQAAATGNDRHVRECEEAVTCAICLDHYEEPRNLSCSHTFCLPCFQRYQKGRTERPCPQCKQLTVPGNDKLTDLKPNEFAAKLVSFLQQHQTGVDNSTSSNNSKTSTPELSVPESPAESAIANQTAGETQDEGSKVRSLVRSLSHRQIFQHRQPEKIPRPPRKIDLSEPDKPVPSTEKSAKIQISSPRQLVVNTLALDEESKVRGTAGALSNRPTFEHRPPMKLPPLPQKINSPEPNTPASASGNNEELSNHQIITTDKHRPPMTLPLPPRIINSPKPDKPVPTNRNGKLLQTPSPDQSAVNTSAPVAVGTGVYNTAKELFTNVQSRKPVTKVPASSISSSRPASSSSPSTSLDFLKLMSDHECVTTTICVKIVSPATGVFTTGSTCLLNSRPEPQRELAEDECSPCQLHRQVRCDNCKELHITGLRFKCGICSDYDLCDNCEKHSEDIHDADHTFVVIPNEALYHAAVPIQSLRFH